MLSPESDARYIFPLLPFIALTLSYLIFYGAPRVQGWSVKWIIVAIVLKFALGILGFPFFHQQSRASFEPIAKDILRTVGTRQLYVTYVEGGAMSIVAHVDRLIYPKAPLIYPPSQFNDGFVISLPRDQNMGILVKKYSVGREEVYLRCKGTACIPRE